MAPAFFFWYDLNVQLEAVSARFLLAFGPWRLNSKENRLNRLRKKLKTLSF
jgi:hypothetical protein